MRYDHLDMLPENAFKPMGKRMTLEGGGGKGKSSSPAPQNSSVYQTNIPEYAKPYVQSMLGAAQSEMFDIDSSGNITNTKPYVPYSTNPEDYVAKFSPLQQTSFNRAAGLGVPSQFGQATQLGGAAGLGSLGLAGQAANAGQQFQNMATNPNAVRAYMDPYLESALAPQLEAMRREYGKTATEQQSRATAAGAFGGSREALMASENERAKNAAMDAALKQGYSNAFQNAQGQMQFGSTLGLQGLGQGLAGLGQAGNIAGTLGNLGTNQLAAQQGVINTQNLLGTQQQQQQQNIINQAIQDYATAQQYPMMQLANMSNLLRGLPMQGSTTQSYQAAPSALSQIGGLGATALGAYGAAGGFKGAKEGGVMKSYAQGGIASYVSGGDVMSEENAIRIAKGLDSKNLQKVQDRTIPDYIRIPMIAAQIKEEQAANQAKAAAQVQPDQPSIKDMVLAQAQGIDAAPTNLPTERMASGGIVAFDEGGEVPGFAEGVYIPSKRDARDLYSELRSGIADVPNYIAGEAAPGIGRQDLIRKLQKSAETPYDAAINYYKSQGYLGYGGPTDPLHKLQQRRQAWVEGQKDPFTGDAPVGSKYNIAGTQTAAPGSQGISEAKPKAETTKDTIRKPAGLRADEATPQVPTTPEAPQKTLADYAKELKDYLGEDTEAKKIEERAKKLEDRAAKLEDQSIWNAIMQGGLKTMQGTSPFALSNIGAGGEAGLASYTASKDKIAALQDKADDYRSAYAKAARAEQLAIAKYGADSKQAAEERAAKEKLQDKHNTTLLKIQTMDNASRERVANIAAGAKSAGKVMTVGDRIKLKEAIDGAMLVEEKKILESLGSNAKNPTSKAYPQYVKQYNMAKQRITADVMGGGTTLMDEPAAAEPSKSGAIRFLGKE